MVLEDNISEGNFLSAINSEQLPFSGSSPRMSLSVPLELIQDMDGSNQRLVSALYHDVEGLLPSSLPEMNK